MYRLNLTPGPFPAGKGSQRGNRQPLLSRASGQCGAGWPRLRREGIDAWRSLQATGVRP